MDIISDALISFDETVKEMVCLLLVLWHSWTFKWTMVGLNHLCYKLVDVFVVVLIITLGWQVLIAVVLYIIKC